MPNKEDEDKEDDNQLEVDRQVFFLPYLFNKHNYLLKILEDLNVF